MSIQLKYKRLKYEIKSLSIAVEEVKAEFDKAILLFEEEFKKQVPEYESKKKKKNKNVTSDKSELTTEKREENKSVKKVYRRIVTQTHPDKLEGLPNNKLKKNLIQKYKDAVNSYQNNDIVSLFDLADELDIKLPEIDESHIISMEAKVTTLNNTIDGYRRSNALIWYKSDEKQEIMLEIIKKLKSEGRI